MNQNIDKIRLVYYSGTGGTRLVADRFAEQLRQRGASVTIQRLKFGEPEAVGEYDLLLLLYAVYAFNAPEPVYEWIKNLPEQQEKQAVVISVSGGGEMSPNTACRHKAIRMLEGKGFRIDYENMLVMPSNIAFATKAPLDKMLLDILPHNVDGIIDELFDGVVRRKPPHLLDRALATMGGLERSGGHLFGKMIRVSKTCNGCGYCAANCPSGNIAMKEDKPVFSTKCYFCMNCLYGCPQHALTPGFGKFAVIKTGLDFDKLTAAPPIEKMSAKQLNTLAPGIAWVAVRKYLTEDHIED
jgi:flavodoxin/NAD-dependent dihydropyrimidine dehydrogenase PreA subunit